MISPFEAVDRRERVPDVGSVSELLARLGREVGSMSFSSMDEPTAIEDEPVEDPEATAAQAAAAAELSRVHAEAVRVQCARSEAFDEARRSFETELELRLVEERRRLDRLRLEFARDRQRFFAASESQVVKLALAVARRILHRDAVTDGLQLRVTVKAALARVQDGSATVLHVPAEECEAWRAMFERGTAGKVEVRPDERMAPGDCRLDTSVGRVELGQEAQMQQVEQGFGELMQEQGY